MAFHKIGPRVHPGDGKQTFDDPYHPVDLLECASDGFLDGDGERRNLNDLFQFTSEDGQWGSKLMRDIG